MRYARCTHPFFSTLCNAATVIFWINQRVAILGSLPRINNTGKDTSHFRHRNPSAKARSISVQLRPHRLKLRFSEAFSKA